MDKNLKQISLQLERKLLSHPSFKQPANRDTKVWRYLTLAKYIDLILTESLFLSRVDLLEDAHEGTYTKFNSERFSLPETQIPSGLILTQSEYTKRMRSSFQVNCWRIDNNDSEAMWKLYCPNNEGVAIQTTYNKLASSLPDEKHLFMGLITYLNYEIDSFDTSNGFNTVMHKRIAFEHEKEVRIVKGNIDYMNDHNLSIPEPGIKINTSLFQNIEKIIVNPYSTKWYFETIDQLFKKIGVKMPIEWSEINAKIYY